MMLPSDKFVTRGELEILAETFRQELVRLETQLNFVRDWLTNLALILGFAAMTGVLGFIFWFFAKGAK